MEHRAQTGHLVAWQGIAAVQTGSLEGGYVPVCTIMDQKYPQLKTHVNCCPAQHPSLGTQPAQFLVSVSLVLV